MQESDAKPQFSFLRFFLPKALPGVADFRPSSGYSMRYPFTGSLLALEKLFLHSSEHEKKKMYVFPLR